MSYMMAAVVPWRSELVVFAFRPVSVIVVATDWYSVAKVSSV